MILVLKHNGKYSSGVFVLNFAFTLYDFGQMYRCILSKTTDSSLTVTPKLSSFMSRYCAISYNVHNITTVIYSPLNIITIFNWKLYITLGIGQPLFIMSILALHSHNIYSLYFTLFALVLELLQSHCTWRVCSVYIVSIQWFSSVLSKTGRH